MKRIITTLILLMGCANFIAQAQNTEYSQSSSGIWFEVRTDSLNPCRYTENKKSTRTIEKIQIAKSSRPWARFPA